MFLESLRDENSFSQNYLLFAKKQAALLKHIPRLEKPWGIFSKKASWHTP